MMYRILLPILLIASWKGVGSTYNRPDAYAAICPRWGYNWGPQPEMYSDPACGAYEAVPMIWSPSQVGRELGGNSAWLMGFNEPYFQQGLWPEDALEAWHELEMIYPDRKLVSPAVINLRWLTEFWELYIKRYGVAPKFQAIAMHCYDSWTPGSGKCQDRADAFVAWAQEREIPEVWVTEFGRQTCYWGGEQAAVEFMQEMVQHFEREPMITRYAWFQATYKCDGSEPWAFPPGCDTSLVDWDTGELTALGEAYTQWPR